MEMPAEQSVALSQNADHSEDNSVPTSLNHGDAEPKPLVSEEVVGILEVIASTGRFWHDWNNLKSMISFYLKQVLSDYPEAKMSTMEEQNASPGETYQEILKRLDEALQRFDDGPPFTLQRLCEILLAARSIYPKISKLALALEKNLLVTSTITVSMDPYPQGPEPDKAGGDDPQPNIIMQNGVEGDGDEVMAEVQEAGIDDDITIDMEGFEEIVASSEPNSTSPPNS